MRLVLHTLATIVVGQGAQILAGIATARAFGPAGKGIISYAGVFIAFTVASVDGLRNAIAYQAGNEGLPLRRVWRSSLALLAVFAPLGTLLFAGLWLHDRSQPAFLYVAIAFPFAAFLQTVNVLYVVRHAIERINVQNACTIGAGSSLVTLAAVLFFHATVAAVLAIWVAGFVIAAVWAALGVPSLLGTPEAAGDARAAEAAGEARAPEAAGDARASLGREQAVFALKGGASALVTMFALRVDILIIGSTLTKGSLGIYATALALGELMWSLSKSVTWATTGRIATEPRPDAIALTAKVVRLLLGVQFLAGAAIFALGPFAIDLLYGDRFRGSGLLLQILLPRIVVYSADGVISYFISVREGRPGVQFAFEFATLVACAALTWAAIGPFGLTGAAIAATASFVLAFFAKLAYFVRVTGSSWRDVLAVRLDDVPPAARKRVRAFFSRRAA